MRKLTLLCSVVVIAVAMASPAVAAIPTRVSGHTSFDAFAFSCGSFDVWDDSEFSWHGTRHFGSDGEVLFRVEQISGVDRLYNPLNDKSVSGTYHNSETLDLANGDVSQNGSIFRIVVPGSGPIFLDVGRYLIDFDEGLTLLAGHHDFFNGDFSAICAYLA
jgi:hypothetical protein